MYRELLYFLARRDILVRYVPTIIGVAWRVLRLTLPDHPQFRHQLRNDGSYLRNGTLMRTIFVASRTPIDAPTPGRC